MVALFGVATLLGFIGIYVDRPSGHARHLAALSSLAQPPREKGMVRNPVLPHNPDPFVLEWEGKWYAYGSVGNSTGGPTSEGYQIGFRVMVGSEDMQHWEDGGMVLIPPANHSMGNDSFWAPELLVKDGVIYMAYSAGHHIYMAKAAHPKGPFTYHAGPLDEQWWVAACPAGSALLRLLPASGREGGWAAGGSSCGGGRHVGVGGGRGYRLGCLGCCAVWPSKLLVAAVTAALGRWEHQGAAEGREAHVGPCTGGSGRGPPHQEDQPFTSEAAACRMIDGHIFQDPDDGKLYFFFA